jgi:hypothetical protein
MVLHLPHAEGGFGVPLNCVTKDDAFYTTTSHFVSWMGAFSQTRQELWFPKDDLRDSSSWSPPFNTGARDRLNFQDDVPQQQEAARLSLP